MVPSAAESSVFGKSQPSQVRSQQQSQQSFSQGFSSQQAVYSQLSQSSLDDFVPNEQVIPPSRSYLLVIRREVVDEMSFGILYEGTSSFGVELIMIDLKSFLLATSEECFRLSKMYFDA